MSPAFVEIGRDQFVRIERLIGDARLRAAALRYAKQRRASGRYRALVRVFETADGVAGAVPLVRRRERENGR